MFKSIVYEGDKYLGEVEIYPQNKDYYYYQNVKNEIKISQYSQSSGRCSPLAVLHAITSTVTSSSVGGLCFKMESKSQSKEMFLLHSSCISDKKTAVIISEKEELHLVAIPSRKNDLFSQCFWGFRVTQGLYNSCLVMLNLRCLGIVFDLDETLVVANTKRSFEDKIESLQRKLSIEVDPQRINGMLAEIKRYQDDKVILMQYVESDQVIENGRVIKSQPEVVPALSNIYPSVVRPIIRLQDKNIILTRINPQIRDTSVLVRLRPAWDDLRSYLIARGRKRFEVFVCTMAERDYALEMWRLLDPDFNLINSKQLLDRLVCVKSGSRKSLLDVFQKGSCHPKMALVIDDRLKVWGEEDQPRVHVVPAFAPYHAPQAEAKNATPVLCVARNVACNVRGGFFKDFDDGMLQTMSQVMYEDDIKELPSSPDVSKYLTLETDVSTLYATKVSVGFDGTSDAEVERRLKEAVPAPSTIPLTLKAQDPRFAHLQFAIPPLPIPNPPSTFQVPFSVKPLPQMPPLVKPEVVLHSSPVREEGEIPETELDPDTRRRLLILQHGQDQKENVAVAPQIYVPRAQENPMLLHHMIQPLNSDALHIEKQRQNHSPFLYEMDGLSAPNRVFENHRFSHEALPRDDRMRQNFPVPSYNSFPGEEITFPPSASSNVGNLEFQRVRFDLSETPAGALQDIAFHCGTKVEFRSAVVPSMKLQFSIEVMFGGEKVGEAIGRTRREAQRKAAETSLMNLAEKYLSGLKPDSVPLQGEMNMSLNSNENCFVLEDSKRSGSITALNELCMMEGFGIAFQSQPPPSDNPIPKHEVYAQVEVDGHVLGEGTGLTWDDAKLQAAEKALGNLQNTLGQFSQKRQGSPREFEGMSNKRPKPEYSRVCNQMPSSR